MRNRSFVQLFGIGMLLCLIGCQAIQPSFVSVEGGYIPVTEKVHNTAKSIKMDSILNSYKQVLDKTMQEVLTIASKPYPKTAPDYAVQKLVIEVLIEAGQNNVKQKIDGAIMNVDGVRGNLPEGDITLGIAYSLFPFDNQLSIITIRGRYLKELERIHKTEGKVVTTGFESFSDDRVYTIVTIDYLSEGNDYCEMLQKAETDSSTTLMLRNLMIDYFKKAKL